MSDDGLQELREAFESWAKDHGAIWWDNDTRLAKAIAAVVGIDLVWNDRLTKEAAGRMKA